MVSKPETAEATIPVRLAILVHIKPSEWTKQAEAPATVDEKAVMAGLLAAGIEQGQAEVMLARLTTPAAGPTGPSTVRTEVREYMLAEVRKLGKLVEAKATVVDSDREPKAAK